MRIAIINVSEEHSQYVGQFYQEHYARLRHYFLPQLGNASEADACVEETMSRFFFFMEDRCWEDEAEYRLVYLMRIAGLICSTKLAAKRMRRKKLGVNEVVRFFAKIRDEVVQPFKERVEFTLQLFLRAGDNARQQLQLWSAPRQFFL